MDIGRKRKPREHGWRTVDGVTHHIDTRHIKTYHPTWRHSTCGVTLVDARRVRVESVDCITCIVRVARRSRLPPRPTPSETTPSWWTVGGERHARSTNDPWRAVCGASLRAASASGNPPNCVACGATPSVIARTRSRRTLDGVRHVMHLDPGRHAPCGADLIGAQIARKGPNCAGCRAASGQEGKDHGRQLPRVQRR